MNVELADSQRTSTTSHRPGGISGIRRNRPSYSCEGCRSRRVKCDLVHPQCGSCARNGMTCVYPNLTAKRASPTAPSRRPSCNKGQRRKSANASPLLDHVVSSSIKHADGAERSFWSSLGDVSHDANILLSESFSTLVRTSDTLFDPISGANSRSMTTEMHPFLNVFDNMTNSISNQTRLADLLAQLPDRSACDYLYGIYICCVHPITPYFHLPTFDSRYHRFWDWYEHWDQVSPPHCILAEIPSFLALLFAVLYYGCVIEPLVTSSVWARARDIEPMLFLSLGTSALGMLDFPHKTTLYSLVAFMLLQMDQLRCQDTSACSFVAVAVRIAQSMGLHREEANARLHPIQAEERRRIWCLLMHIDMVTARRAGLAPLLASPPKGGVILLSEIRDEYIGIKVKNDSRHANPAFILARGRYEASLCIKPILARQVDHNAVTLADIRGFEQPVRLLALDLEERILRIRKMGVKNMITLEAGFVSQYTQSRLRLHPEDCMRWAEATLRYNSEQAYCELYNLALVDLSVWNLVRNEAIPHYQAHVRHFIDLCTTHGYRPIQWMYPGYHQPIKSVAVLLVDLHREPHSEYAYDSRALVDKLFFTCRLAGESVSQSSRKPLGDSTIQRPFATAWSSLANLRKTVWESIGLDPTMPWCEAVERASRRLPVTMPLEHRDKHMSDADIRMIWDEQHNSFPSPWVRNVQTLQLTAVFDNSTQFQHPYYGSDASTVPTNALYSGHISDQPPAPQSLTSEVLNTDLSWILEFDGDHGTDGCSMRSN